MENVDSKKEQIISLYSELNSSYKVASVLNVSATAVKRILKNAGVLRTQKQAALERDNSYVGIYVRTNEHKSNLSKHAKNRIGDKNHFFGKKHDDKAKEQMSIAATKRIAEKNSNFRHGKNLRRPRDFKNAEMAKLRQFVFNRDKFTCQLTKQIGGHLHAHHLIPYWVCSEAFLDAENLITVQSSVHFEICHKGAWGSFDVNLIPDSLIQKYSLDRERLNEMALLFKKGCESLTSTNK